MSATGAIDQPPGGAADAGKRLLHPGKVVWLYFFIFSNTEQIFFFSPRIKDLILKKMFKSYLRETSNQSPQNKQKMETLFYWGVRGL